MQRSSAPPPAPGRSGVPRTDTKGKLDNTFDRELSHKGSGLPWSTLGKAALDVLDLARPDPFEDPEGQESATWARMGPYGLTGAGGWTLCTPNPDAACFANFGPPSHARWRTATGCLAVGNCPTGQAMFWTVPMSELPPTGFSYGRVEIWKVTAFTGGLTGIGNFLQQWSRPASPNRDYPIARAALPIPDNVPNSDADPKTAKKLKTSPFAKTATALLSNREQQLKPHERAAVGITVQPAVKPDITKIHTSPPYDTVHKLKPDKAGKIDMPAWMFTALKLYHGATEVNDFFESLADAMPGKPCSAKPGFQRALCVIENWDKIDPAQAAINLVYNEIEDRVVAKTLGAFGEATSTGYNDPSITRSTSYIKNVMGNL